LNVTLSSIEQLEAGKVNCSSPNLDHCQTCAPSAANVANILVLAAKKTTHFMVSSFFLFKNNGLTYISEKLSE